MNEHFIVSYKNSLDFSTFKIIAISLIISLVIIMPILNIASFEGIGSIVILTSIMYLIITNMSNEPLSFENESTLYPMLPHTGLDGISINNYVAGLDTSKFI